jgi:hypothetical protein
MFVMVTVASELAVTTMVLPAVGADQPSPEPIVMVAPVV